MDAWIFVVGLLAGEVLGAFHVFVWLRWRFRRNVMMARN
jgi:hypothetical protein